MKFPFIIFFSLKKKGNPFLFDLILTHYTLDTFNVLFINSFLLSGNEENLSNMMTLGKSASDIHVYTQDNMDMGKNALSKN